MSMVLNSIMSSRTVVYLLLFVVPLWSGCAGAPIPPTPTDPLPTPALTGDGPVINISSSEPCCPKQTLPEFLGLTGLFKGIGSLANRVRSRLGSRFPGLEPTPPMLQIADPSNISSPNPAVASAAEIKAEEDQAPQKIKALRYLASIGCGGCYPGPEEAFLAALDDCTEEVRYEAASALRGATGNACQLCNQQACCSPRVRERLQKIGNEMDEEGGCYREPSARVRREARMALNACGGPPATIELPLEGPDAPLPTPAEGPDSGMSLFGDLGDRGSAVQVVAWNSAVPAAGDTLTSTRLAPRDLLATVNGEPIYFQDVAQRLAGYDVQSETAGAAPRDPALFAQELEIVIDRTLLCQQARRAAAEPSTLEEGSHGDTSQVSSLVSSRGNQASGAAADAMAFNWLRQQIRIDQHVTDGQLRTHYEDQRDRFVQPSLIRWEMATAPMDRFTTREDAIAAIDMVRRGATGDTPPTPTSIDLRVIETQRFNWTDPREVGDPRVALTLMNLPVGGVSEILAIDEKFFIVRVLERKDAVVTPLETIAAPLQAEIRHQRRERAERDYLGQLRTTANIWRNPKLFAPGTAR